MTEINSPNDLVRPGSGGGESAGVVVVGLAGRRGDRPGRVNRRCMDVVGWPGAGSGSGGGAGHGEEVERLGVVCLNGKDDESSNGGRSSLSISLRGREHYG